MGSGSRFKGSRGGDKTPSVLHDVPVRAEQSGSARPRSFCRHGPAQGEHHRHQCGGGASLPSQVGHFVFHSSCDLLQAVSQLHLLGCGVLLQSRDDLPRGGQN